MAMIFSIITRKGGSGKSTLTRLLAGEFAYRDMTVHLINADDQNTLGVWMERLAKQGTLPPQITCSGLVMKGNEQESIADLMQQIEANQDKDVILIDPRGVASMIGLVASRLSNMVLIPVRPSVDDTRPAIDTAKAVMDAVPEGENPPVIRFVLNGVPMVGGVSAIRDAALDLSESGYVVLQSAIHHRGHIANMNNGEGTLYTLPDQKNKYLESTKKEVQSVIDRIEKILNQGFDEDEAPEPDEEDATHDERESASEQPADVGEAIATQKTEAA